MNISTEELILWIIVGLIAGSVAGAVVNRSKEGFGPWKNLTIGLVGAVIGGLVFNYFKIRLGLGELKISLDDLVSALLGSFLLLLIIWIIKR